MDTAEEPLAGKEPREAKRSRGRLVLLAALVAAVLVAFFLPPLINLGHYRHSITTSIASALGRPVSVGDMQLRLLPMPGITMTDFTVAEDPAFGYEPILHANSVVASLRLTSLWRGRLEVSRISLDEASLNLVKNGAGEWNLATVLLRASQVPNEATAQRHAGAHLRFPYIEATNARINFKEGVEKRPFSLTNAEFAMWQASGGEWRLRLKAQPVRTDLELHLSDTGELKVEGSVRRAENVHAMPVNLEAEWSGAQLGQMSHLLSGADSGWRGDPDVTATITGTAGDLALKARVRVDNLRRQEFEPATALNVDASCQSGYRHALQLLGNITCFLPVGGGHLLLTGSLRGGTKGSADLQLEMNQIPAQYPLTALGLLRPHAGNVTATGTMNGSFHLVRGAQIALTGDAATTPVTLAWSGKTLALPAMHLAAQQPAPEKKKSRRTAKPEAAQPPAVTLEPFAVPFGEPSPLSVDAQFVSAGFVVHLNGAAAVDRVLAAGGTFGFLRNSLGVVSGKGRADLNITTTGPWIDPLGSSGSAIMTTGTVKVQGVELHPGFLHTPVEVASAEIDLTPEKVAWENAAFNFQGMAMRGSLEFPSVCTQPAPCPSTFTLQPGAMSAATLEKALQGKQKGFLGQMLSGLGGGTAAPWPPLQGTLQSDSVSLGRLALRNVIASLHVEGTKLTIDSLDAAALGGTVHGTGEMTLAGGTPQWVVDVQMKGVRASDAAALFRERWGAGAGNAEAHLKMSGWQTADLASSTSGSFQFTWQNGGFAIAGAGSPLARFDRWTADGAIANGTLTLQRGGLTRAGNTTAVRGTVGFDRRLALALGTRRGDVQVSGTMARPVVER